ncbi:hypothetical protein [Dysgonomonas sp. 520]|uniref:hypothetical protein n=1 Tax=Dysgonomonas sp. 520 TaxID=2302931 RepID=UPI0013D86EA3|nr:hypothetical protein [Dysgonomonas sp. 520]NDW08949.1 hypothetical protein [Dysgonomonas sp. 520]
MKKLLSLILIATLFVGCSSDDEKHTSFQIKNTSKIATFYNVVAGYRVPPNNTLKKIADLGDIGPGESSKKIIIEDLTHEIEFFDDVYFQNGEYTQTYLLSINTIRSNRNNLYSISEGKTLCVEKDNPEEYPQ